MNDIIATDAHKLASSSSAFINLYELEIDGSTLYFHSENTDDDIVFDGNTYSIFPMFVEGIELNADGAQNRPHLTLANVNSILSTQVKSDLGLSADFVMEDLIGSRITRRQTLAKYTGAVTPYEFPSDVYVLDRIASKNQLIVSIELASPFDFGGTRVPSRLLSGKYCPWTYKGYTVSNTDVKSACFWKDENQVVSGSSTYSFFYTIDDEPLLKNTLSSITGAAAWASGTTYAEDSIVTYNNLYWASKENSNQGNTPIDNSIFWKVVRPFSVWSTDGAASYTVDPIDVRNSSYVYHANTVWRAVRSHNRSTDFTPGNAPSYWTPGDVCGKLLSSCKVRYQAQAVTNSGTGNDAQAKTGTFNTDVPLPFGGFPSATKFR
jgi:lambda family phage minor tail protein L